MNTTHKVLSIGKEEIHEYLLRARADALCDTLRLHHLAVLRVYIHKALVKGFSRSSDGQLSKQAGK